jgi:hypothetical protein
MPLKKGHSKEVVSDNIKEMMKAGHPQKQAIAAALTMARKYKKMSEGGMVDPDYDEDVSSDFEDNAVRGLNEIRVEGKFQENVNASPKAESDEQMLARALHKKAEKDEMASYAMGGLVEGPKDVGTEEPDENMVEETSEPMSELEGHVAEEAHAPIGLSKEQQEAIERKKKSRRFF